MTESESDRLYEWLISVYKLLPNPKIRSFQKLIDRFETNRNIIELPVDPAFFEHYQLEDPVLEKPQNIFTALNKIQRKAIAFRLFKSGIPAHKICEILGISRSTLYNWLRR